MNRKSSLVRWVAVAGHQVHDLSGAECRSTEKVDDCPRDYVHPYRLVGYGKNRRRAKASKEFLFQPVQVAVDIREIAFGQTTFNAHMINILHHVVILALHI